MVSLLSRFRTRERAVNRGVMSNIRVEVLLNAAVGVHLAAAKQSCWRTGTRSYTMIHRFGVLSIRRSTQELTLRIHFRSVQTDSTPIPAFASKADYSRAIYSVISNEAQNFSIKDLSFRWLSSSRLSEFLTIE